MESEETDNKSSKKKGKSLIPFDRYEDLVKRSITQETCERFGYFVSESEEGQKIHVAPYRDASGRVVGQKIRSRKDGKKHFYTTGDFSDVVLFGQHLWKNGGGKRIVVTEGEIDALSVSQIMPTWPVVSLPNGAQSARKAISKSIEFLETYDQVVLLFDMDEPGQKAARDCVDLLSPGKCAIATLPLKDANEMLKEGRVKELNSAIWEAQVARPDGVINCSELWEEVSKPIVMGNPYPWEGINKMTFGMRGREIITLTAGSGIGKSAVCAEVAYDLAIQQKEPIGYVALEEGKARTGLRFMAIHVNKPIHLPGFEITVDERRSAFDQTLGLGRIWTYDHFGSTESDNLLSKLRYLVKACGVKWLVLDHLSIVVSSQEEDDERKAIDRTMTRLRMFTEETGVGLILVSHLKRPEGRGHEEGAATSLAQLRGSAAIAQLSDIVIGLERNQQDEEKNRNVLTVRVLKNRYAGITGVACQLRYDPDTGRLTEDDGFQDESSTDDDDTL